uniref:Uncharacterized protein n=1 Tax=Tanacetum cinerariifolium TaxID=118510 RepID=A0A699XR67_TANCI|nr:hypothetical protein [Tanacetum cinerariifolium]
MRLSHAPTSSLDCAFDASLSLWLASSVLFLAISSSRALRMRARLASACDTALSDSASDDRDSSSILMR